MVDDIPRVLLAADMYAYLNSLNGHVAYTATLPDSHVPCHYGEAMQWADLWKVHMEAELENLREHEVFEVVPRSSVLVGKKVIDCMWVYTNKYNTDRTIVKWKACLVAKGLSQIPGVNFNETYALFVHLESMQMSAAIAAHLGLCIWQADFVSIYLNSCLKHMVYMHLLPGYAHAWGRRLGR